MSSPLSVYEPVPASHVDHLWVAATLRGLEPAPPETSRVLELACGDGSNLIPMAYHRPEARFVGVEGSAAARASARASAAALGLDNVTFVGSDLDAVRRRPERYDYVVMHGVLSTVSGAARAGVLALSAGVLAERGVLYVDHLGRAGRLIESRLRELVRRAVGCLPTVAERVAAIRAILEVLDAEPPDPGNPHSVHARVEITFAMNLDDAALVTHFLAPFREALSPGEVGALASRHGLTVFDTGWDPGLDRLAERRTRDRLAALAGPAADDLVELATGRRTHSALLCRTEALAGGARSAPAAERGTFAAKLETRLPDVLLTPGIEVAFTTRSGRMVRTKDPLDKALLTALRDAWPSGLGFGELLSRATAQLAEGSPERAPPGPDEIARQPGALLELCRLDAITWRSREPVPRQDAGGPPRVAPLTAWQASRSHLLTDAQHRLVVVDELTRRVVGLLDGARDVAEIAAEIEGLREAGEITLAPAVAPSPGDDVIGGLVATAIDGLRGAGLLDG